MRESVKENGHKKWNEQTNIETNDKDGDGQKT